MSFKYEPEHYRSLMERYGLPEDVIDGILCMHAHELAERIRNHLWNDGCAAGCCDDDRGAQKAADLIDPEVST